jgi:hypothetical protein
MAVDTRADSVASNPATHYFRVVAHNYNTQTLFKSNVMAGRSVDNLAPSPPFLLSAQRVGNDVQVKWNRVHAADLRDYAVYRATSAGVTPLPLNFLEGTIDTVLVDHEVSPGAYYYIVTAYDVHGNQSAASNETPTTTNVGNTPPLTSLAVLPNSPNPFSATTLLSIGLPKPSDISIEVFDVAGRRVKTSQVKGAGAGWRHIEFAGTDDVGRPLASGVYFYRVTAAGSTVTRKMVITR